MNNKIIIVIGLIILAIGGFLILTKNKPSISPESSPQPTVEISPNTVEISNFAFNPSEITVKKGTTVTWINKDTATHKIKSDTFNSEDLNQGGTFNFTFENTGSFDYVCGIHPSMTGNIKVE